MKLSLAYLFLFLDCVLSVELLNRLSSDLIEELKLSFNLLDHNKDGEITLHEASLGVLSKYQKYSIDIKLPNVVSFYDSCENALPDGPLFIDCIVQSARNMINNNENDNKVMTFDESLKNYFESSQCDDYIPFTNDEITCHEIVSINRKNNSDYLSLYEEFFHINNRKISTNTCEVLSLFGYCRFSCRKCVSEQSQEVFKVKSSSNSDSYIPVLISSDWHVEPWYEPDIETTVARYSYPTCDNMWNCFDKTSTIDCILNGVSDPSIDLIESHILSYETLLSNLVESSNIKLNKDSDTFNGLLFYGGDTQAHDYSSSYLGDCDEAIAISDLISQVVDLLVGYWDPSDIFITPGNNDGPHNSIFSSNDGDVYTDSEAYADVFISSGIINNDLGLTYDYSYSLNYQKSDVTMNQTEFFSHTGYYMKEIDPSNKYLNKTIPLYVISYNTNLGTSSTVQQNALLKDLEIIKNNDGGLYLLGHHPDVTKKLIPDDYTSIVKGMFSGHTHEAKSTNKNLFTQVPAISQSADVTGYFLAKISADNDYEIILSTKEDLIICDNDASIGNPASSDLWSYA